MNRICRVVATIAAVTVTYVGSALTSSAADLPPFAKISEGYKQLPVSDQQAKKGLFNVWQHEKEASVIAELPKNFAGKKYFVALTLSSGDRYAGLQSGDWVVQWRRYNDRLALIAPNLDIRATGDAESKASVKRLFTDRVLLDVPILAMGPNGGPVVDMDSLLIGNATTFFGSSVRLANSRLFTVEAAKVFPENVELAFEVVGRGGRLQTLHYSFSEVPSSSSGFKPREADERVGFFVTSFSDLSQYQDDETKVRYINRWHLEKRDPKLKLSPPKEPIRFYVEHTAPVRYRRWIKKGVDYWNKAFEKVGIVDAIVIEYQDAVSKIHMEKDPEDVRYNFVRWLNNDVGTAIGPSRVHPETGQILDADIILTDGWIRHFNFNYNDLMPKLAMEGVSAETLAWLGSHPNWDPRVRMGATESANSLRAKYALEAQQPMAGYAMAQADPSLLGDDEFDGLMGQVSQKNGLCMAASGRSMDLAFARMNWGLALMADKEAEKKKEEEAKANAEAENVDKDAKADADAKEEDKKDQDEESDEEESDGDKKDDEKKDDEEKDSDKEKDELLDGIPEWFVGPLLADLVAHEVGHTLGLRHNFKASGLYTIDEINSEELKGKKTFTASVMDYCPINYRYEAGEVQGDYAMIDIGPYDFWAIEYGYTFEDSKIKDILKRCSEPELQYATDEDTSGPDPYARRYDFGKDPLTFAEEQMRLVQLYRERLLEKFVKEGDSWAKARRGYELTLAIQTKSVSMMANWIGGAFVNRDKKGDPGNRVPVEVVPAADQRAALQYVIDTSFRDESYGLTTEILERLGVDKWLDSGRGGMSNEATWPIHDRVLGMQASTLTLIMNPTTLRRVYDNELRLPAETDALTLPELLDTVSNAVWEELDQPCPEDRNDRKPMISSLRRNLQREHIQRLVDLILEEGQDTAAYHPISNLARMQLRTLASRMDSTIEKCGKQMDAYSLAHLTECKERIERALEAGYTYGGGKAGAPMLMMLMGQEPASTSNED
ncbi:zinc-dependent metalloprotease [Rhodopirellula sp. P2]|uniref:zinc-dependent metalloprotease n=1 Tax=Rhodopirellula sp. P2 TaxID=2127060 RepID=UPI0023686257|nr:zinc-dependent metalloprotease [Rhodopirellula sp. P2]WDQ19113.1 zinc-dependent metalloprotease [Rhodopirellula sp. P2]